MKAIGIMKDSNIYVLSALPLETMPGRSNVVLYDADAKRTLKPTFVLTNSITFFEEPKTIEKGGTK